MAGGLHREPRYRRKNCTRRKFSWLRSGTSHKSDFTEAQYFYSLAKRQKLRGRQENQDYEGSLQKANWKFSISSTEVWWFDHSWSQSPQSSILSRGTRFSYSMDSVVPLQKRKLLRRRKRVYGNFLSRLKSQKSFTVTIRWNLVNLVKIYHGIIVLPQLIDLRRTGLPKEKRAEWRKERLQCCCNLARPMYSQTALTYMLVLGSNWQTWHSFVRKQACSRSPQMDTSLWQTFSSFVFFFITRMNFDNIVMWIIQLNTADWVCSKTPIMLVTLRTRSQHQEGSYVCPEVEHLFP